MSFLICSHLNLCVRLQLCVSRLIWLLCYICNMLLLAWLFRWMLWCRLAHWFESLFCSAFFLHAHLIVAENLLIHLIFKSMLRVLWLSFLFEALSACWICMTCKIDEWVHIFLSWRKFHIIWLNSNTSCELSSMYDNFVSWTDYI